MNKSELCTQLAEKGELTTDDAVRIVDTFFSSIREALLDGKRVEIRGLCSWQMKEYPGYSGRNPNTGHIVNVAPKRLPFFKAGKELKEMINRSSKKSSSTE